MPILLFDHNIIAFHHMFVVNFAFILTHPLTQPVGSRGHVELELAILPFNRLIHVQALLRDFFVRLLLVLGKELKSTGSSSIPPNEVLLHYLTL